MPTLNITVGTTCQVLASPSLQDKNEWLDVILQNISANNIYISSDADPQQTTLDAVRLGPGEVYVNDHRGEPIWVIADGVTSNIRFHYVRYRDSTRTRV